MATELRPSTKPATPAKTESFVDQQLAKVHQRVRLRDLALHEYSAPRHQAPARRPQNFVENKAPNTIRTALLPLLGVNSMYELDRLDLTVQTTIDQPAQQGITQFIEKVAEQYGPADADLRNNFGVILARSGELQAAAAQFEAAIQANPSHESARRNLEAVRRKLGQH